MNNLVDEVYDIILNGGIGFSFKETSLHVLKDKIEITGHLQFNQIYKEVQLQDEYLIQILLPTDFPNTIPIVKEMNGRIPSSADYHNNKEGTGFCLGVPGEINGKIYNNPTFEYFVSKIVVPFLYAHTFHEKYNEYPWLTREHCSKGIIEYYQDLFKFKDEKATKKFLFNIAFFKNPIKGHNLCPCESGIKFRNCHRSKYIELTEYHSHKNIQKDVLQIIKDNNGPKEKEDILKEPLYTKKWYKLYRNCLRFLIKKI